MFRSNVLRTIIEQWRMVSPLLLAVYKSESATTYECVTLDRLYQERFWEIHNGNV